MGLKLRYIDDGAGIECTVTGKATLDAFIKACNEVYDEKHIHKQKYQIIDFTSCPSFDLTTKDMLALAEIDIYASRINPKIIIAIIAREDLAFGMSRVYEAYADETGFNIKVFRDRESGESWIQSLLANNA